LRKRVTNMYYIIISHFLFTQAVDKTSRPSRGFERVLDDSFGCRTSLQAFSPDATRGPRTEVGNFSGDLTWAWALLPRLPRVQRNFSPDLSRWLSGRFARDVAALATRLTDWGGTKERAPGSPFLLREPIHLRRQSDGKKTREMGGPGMGGEGGTVEGWNAKPLLEISGVSSSMCSDSEALRFGVRATRFPLGGRQRRSVLLYFQMRRQERKKRKKRSAREGWQQ